MTAAYLTATQVAELLGVDRASVYRWAAADPSMPAARLGAGTLRFRADLLERWLAERTQSARRRSAGPTQRHT